MKVKALVSYHDTTVDKIYETISVPSWAGFSGSDSVWIIDDVGDEYIFFGDEYEVVDA